MQVFSKVFALSERVTFQILKDFPERKRIFADGSLILGSNTLGLLGENSRLLVDEETLWLSWEIEDFYTFTQKFRFPSTSLLYIS